MAGLQNKQRFLDYICWRGEFKFTNIGVINKQH